MLSPAAKRQRYISDLLEVTKPSDLDRIIAREVRSAREAYKEVSEFVEKVAFGRSFIEALLDNEDRWLDFTKLGAEKSIDKVASLLSAPAWSPILVVNKIYMDVLFDAIKSVRSLERARNAFERAQQIAQSTPIKVEKELKPYEKGGKAFNAFEKASGAYAFSMSFLKGYLTPELLKSNPKLVIEEILKARERYRAVKEAGLGVSELVSLKILLVQMRLTIVGFFRRYRSIMIEETNKTGFLSSVWKSQAIISDQTNAINSLQQNGHDTESWRWMVSSIDTLTVSVDRQIAEWLVVDANCNASIAQLDLYSGFR